MGDRPCLLSNAIDNDRKAVVFEYLTNFHLIAVLWYWLSGNRIYFHQVGEATRNTWWFRRLSASERLRPITLIRHLYTCGDQARELPFDLVDEIYDNHFRRNSLVKKLVRFFDSQSTYLAFKKAVATELERYLFYRFLETIVFEPLNQCERLIFVPRHFGFAVPPRSFLPHLESVDRPRNMVSPGITVTDLTASFSARVKEVAAGTSPMRRLATSQVTGEMVAFLASDAAEFINGSNLPLTGGPI